MSLSRLVVGALALTAVVVSGEEINLLKKHRNLAATSSMSELFASAASGTSGAAQAAQNAAQMMASTSVGPEDPELAQIQKFIKGDINEHDMIQMIYDSEGFKALESYPQMLRSVLDAFPVLDALPAFQTLRSSNTDDANFAKAFTEGLKEVANQMNDVMAKTMDQEGMQGVVDSVMNDPSPGVQALVKGFKEGDPTAVKDLTIKVQKELFPGLSPEAMYDMFSVDKVMEAYKALENNTIIMDIVDRDEYMSKLIREPTDMRTVMDEWGYTKPKA